jgi:predicted dehydrogenase
MPIHVGIVGGGNISETHARAAEAIPGVEIAAVFGTNHQRVEHLAGEYGCAAYSNFEKFLAHKPMDFVAIGSPSGVHAEQGIAAARRGLHVLTEKPIDITTQAADALIAAATEERVKLGVFFQDRFKGDLIRVKKWLDSGLLGKPILADARVKWFRPPEYYGHSSWRGTLRMDGGGALINQAIHTVDLLLWFFGDVVRVQAQKKTAFHQIEAEDMLVALLEFANGATGVFQATTLAYPGYPRRVELTGEEGTITIEHDRLVATDLRKPPGDTQGQGDDRNPSASSPAVSDVRGHQAVMEDFIQAIQKNLTPRCSGAEARRSLALVEALYEACETGGQVELGKRH